MAKNYWIIIYYWNTVVRIIVKEGTGVRSHIVNNVKVSYTTGISDNSIFVTEGVYAEPPSDQFPKFPLRIHCYHQLKYPQDYFTWCVHILSQKYNISGCMNASGIITQTPAAKVLGLLNLFKIDLLSQSILGELYITKLDPLLDGALVSCSVNKTMAIGFKRLLILRELLLPLTQVF